LFQGGDHAFPFAVFEFVPGEEGTGHWSGVARGGGVGLLQLGQLESDRAALGEDHRAFDGVLKLPNVARPIVGAELFHGRLGNAGGGSVHSPGGLRDEMLGQGRNVFRPFPEGRNFNREHTQAIEQVLIHADLHRCADRVVPMHEGVQQGFAQSRARHGKAFDPLDPLVMNGRLQVFGEEQVKGTVHLPKQLTAHFVVVDQIRLRAEDEGNPGGLTLSSIARSNDFQFFWYRSHIRGVTHTSMADNSVPNPIFPDELLARLKRSRVVAGFPIEREEHAVPLAAALLAGGIDTIELTLRTPAAMAALRIVCAEVPKLRVGVGTILTPELVKEVKAAGADFGVAPGMNPRVVRAAREAGLPFAPGIATPSDLEAAIELGCRFVKFFPAEATGGVSYLRSMSAPYKHLGIQYFPLGGLNADNMSAYLAEANVPVIGGSWIAKKDLIDAEDWAGITARAAAVCKLLKQGSNDE
jgi:2-dehydro-3-deoxyphosphogluconate aldolase/(4S)-4-hydroxy-2-oxoglutarate aldolase